MARQSDLARKELAESGVMNAKYLANAYWSSCRGGALGVDQSKVAKIHAVCPLHGYKFDLTSGACANDSKLKARIFKLAADGENYTVEE